MSRETVYRCAARDCDTHVVTTDPAPRPGWLVIILAEGQDQWTLDLCSWECTMRYAAGVAPIETVTVP